jgi:hypothetical protein
MRNANKNVVENQKGRDPLEDLDMDGMITSDGTWGNRVEKCELHASGFREGPVADTCEHGNESSGSIKGRKFLEYMSSKTLLRRVRYNFMIQIIYFLIFCFQTSFCQLL